MTYPEPSITEAACDDCGAAMFLNVLYDDTWGWRAEGGNNVELGLPAGCETAWDVVAQARQAMGLLGESKRPKSYQPSDEELAAGRLYSDLSASLDLLINPFLHVHRTSARAFSHVEPEDVPECCAEPMQARPTGWSCRKKCAA